MPKATKSEKAMPLLLREALGNLGRNIAVARKRRRISMTDMAARMMVSLETLQRLEKGDPKVGIGIVATALWVLGLHGRINALAAPETDEVGLQEDIRRLRGGPRKKSSRKQHQSDDLDF